MRLSDRERQVITESIRSLFRAQDLKIYLFGSRVDDKKRGGDIDILVVVEDEALKQDVASSKSRIRHNVFQILPEQKIDITVCMKSELDSDAFLRSLQLIEL